MPRMTPGGSTQPRSGRALRVLVADDDPASRRFLGDGLRMLGANPSECADGVAALDCARREPFDLLLLDCRMPGAGARQILAALRRDSGAPSANALAIATSAEFEPGDRARLLADGFCDVLLKPCDIATLQRLLALARAQHQDATVLDDDAAMVSAGDPDTLLALRGLLREELLGLHRELDRHGAELPALGDRLHRLRSSCGFCGATVLGTQAMLLQRHLAQDPGSLAAVLPRFRRVLLATMQALERPASDR